MESATKNKKISLLNILIDFFASIYDLGYDFIKLLIDFFASLYDMAFSFIFFFWEYLKWITDLRPVKSQDFTKQAEESTTSK
nr:hypothetical protein [uncultured Flavobacterium sp.]